MSPVAAPTLRSALHVTNGDLAADAMRAAGVEGRIVPWRDVLHEGPVPGGGSLDELRPVRARFLAACGWSGADDPSAVERDFVERDAAFEEAALYDETVLWFEHDLYDQLQLVQILDAVTRLERRPVCLTLAQLDDDYVSGLDADAVRALFARRRPVRDAQLALAARAWRAFGASDPRALERLLADDTTALPHLAPALRRLLEELPDARDGLSRTERAALEAIAAGAATLADVYREARAREERIHLGDSPFAGLLERVSDVERPLVRLEDGAPLRAPRDRERDGARLWGARVVLTPLGERVLAGEADRVRECGIDRWLGGVHLTGHEVPWRWDARAGRIVTEREGDAGA